MSERARLNLNCAACRRRSIIAGSCCHGVMRWAELLRRSRDCPRCASGACVESNGFGKAGLAVVEGPEFLDAQLKRAGYVERVEGAGAEAGGEALCEIYREVQGGNWEVNSREGAVVDVLLEILPCPVGLSE